MTATASAPVKQADYPHRTPKQAADGVALYQRVKDHITGRIQDGTLRAGDRLPTEHALVAQFGISRMTVNRALRELVAQGRIVRRAGAGSFVVEQKPRSTLLEIVNLASEIRQRGHDYACHMLLLERIAATLEVASALQVRTGASVFHSVCVHLEDGVPIQLEDRFVNPQVVPDFGAQDFSQQQPSEFLVRTVPYDEIEHVVDAVLPNAEQALRLQMSAAEPCLLLTRRTWSRGVPVTLVRCLHPASRYRLSSRYSANGSPLSR